MNNMTEEKKTAIRSKIENFWYYYKWYVVVGAFFLALIIIIAVQLSQRKEEDMQIMIVTGYNNAAVTDSACGEIQYFIRREYASDRDGDGETTVKYVHYNVGASTDSTTMQGIVTSIYSAESFLIICDDAGYEYLCGLGETESAADVLEPLDGILSNEALTDKYRVSLKGTRLGELETINETEDENELYACLRVFTGTRVQGDKAASSRYEQASDVLKKIINDKQENTVAKTGGL